MDKNTELGVNAFLDQVGITLLLVGLFNLLFSLL